MNPRRVKRSLPRRGTAQLRRGVVILPSLFTVGNMFFGYYAIILASKHNFEWAVTMVILAGVLDGLDGRIARMTGTTSEFGKELDSLSDFLSFGLAPALVLYHWGFAELGRPGGFLVFLLPVAGALRLARFNVQSATGDKRYFVGLPIPAAAAAAVLPLYFLAPGLSNLHIDDAQTLHWIRIGCLLYVLTLAWLMVSTVRFRSFKDVDSKARQPSVAFFFIAVVVVLIALNPPVVMLIIAVTYAVSGPASWLWGKVFRKRVQEATPSDSVKGKLDDEH